MDAKIAPQGVIIAREFTAKDLGQRIPAAALEALVTHRIRDWLADCQSALDWDPLSASKRDPFERRVRPVALAPSELAGVAETVRARVV